MERSAIASVALIAATPPATYFVVGDQSEPGARRYLDYFWTPPSWSTTTVTIVGVTALVVVAASALVIGHGRRSHVITRTTLTIDALLAVAGVFVAWFYRICTAGVGGANIGAGLVILFGTPLLLTLLVSAITIAIRDRRRRSTEH
jgi:Co/Zn/Cd efflux system component